MDQKEFKLEKIAVVSKFNTGYDGIDFIKDMMTAKLEAHVLSCLVNEQTVTHYFPKPTFMEWLMGRTRKVEIKSTVKDIMLDPPSENVLRTYNFEKQ